MVKNLVFLGCVFLGIGLAGLQAGDVIIATLVFICPSIFLFALSGFLAFRKYRKTKIERAYADIEETGDIRW